MTPADQIAQEILDYACARLDITLGTRADLKRFIAKKIQPLAPEQATLSFADQEALKGQSAAILKLLKQRRSAGAMNWELSELSLKYTSRVSDLRAAGYKIHCQVEAGRTRRYVLAATDW